MNNSLHVEPIDWSAFLGGVEVSLTRSARENLRGKRILVTGAGGSIGSALSKRIAEADPSALTLLDQSELGLYEVGRDLEAAGMARTARLVIGSVCDASFVSDLFHVTRPQIVFHAAACKHVPLLESNAFAAATTNVLGTRSIADAAANYGVEQCILLSTDKAVEPTSMMGATKRIAEYIFLAHNSPTRLKVLRLGNVLGSSGSVVPLFLEQIRRGQRVTVAHDQATRYFLTCSAAVTSLIACASQVVPTGLLIPRMGIPHRVIDLARFLIECTSSRFEEEMITICGLRPGDKLAEQITSPHEVIESIPLKGNLQKVKTAPPTCAAVEICVKTLVDAVERRDLHLLLQAVRLLVPEYRTSELLEEQLHKALEAENA